MERKVRDTDLEMKNIGNDLDRLELRRKKNKYDLVNPV